MKKRSYMLPAIIAMTVLSANAKESQVGSGETDGYKLVWQDLFDNGSLRSDRWNIEVNGDGGGNSELQYYTNKESNVHVGDDGNGNGCLILTAIRESYNGKSFTSGRINSLGLTYFTHGKVEASIKMPTTNAGLWPAFWMMGNDFSTVGWPRCGETDIVEMGHANGINNNVSDRFFNGACHWGNNHYQYAQDKTLSYSLQDGNFHLFTAIWDDDFISMYVDLDQYPDQEPYYKIAISTINESDESCAGNYFHKDNFILFNLAVGGQFPGIYNADGITALNSGNNNQASMYVNYVKVYQKEGEENITMQASGDIEGEDNNDDNNDDNSSTVEPSSSYQVNPTAATVLASNSVGTVHDIAMDSASRQAFVAQGATIVDVEPDGADRNFWIWSNTFENGDTSKAGVGDHTEGYNSLVIGTQYWSGAGYNVTGSGVNTTAWTDETRFHLGYMSPGTVCPSVAVTIADQDGYNTPARIALGEDYTDGSTVYPAIVAAPTAEWQGLDISFADLKKEFSSFSYNATDAWTGNIFAFLCGGTTGQTIAFDAVYFYTPGENETTAVEGLASEKSAWVVTRNTVNCAGANAIALYDLSGKLIKKVNGSVLGLNGVEAGLYIARSGKSATKVLVK